MKKQVLLGKAMAEIADLEQKVEALEEAVFALANQRGPDVRDEIIDNLGNALVEKLDIASILATGRAAKKRVLGI